jgi:DnaJ-class molecular chaperone
MDVCDACGGTGIEEGREWDGYPCTWCKGKKFVQIQDDDFSGAGETAEDRFRSHDTPWEKS